MATNIFVFCPAFGQNITATTFLTVCGLQQHFAAKGIGGGVSTLSFPDIAELRAMATTIWYDAMPQCSHLLFIDADMGFEPDLVTDMLMLDEPVVGAIYRQRKEPVSWAGSGTGTPTTERRGDFMVVEGVGMGVTLIRRDAITALLAKFPEIVDTRLHLHPAGETLKQAGATRLIRAFEKLDLPERGIVSEDLSFCIRLGRCGIKTWASIGRVIHHVGPYDYAGCYLQMIQMKEADEAAKKDEATKTVFVPPPSTNGAGAGEALAVAAMAPSGHPDQLAPAELAALAAAE